MLMNQKQTDDGVFFVLNIISLFTKTLGNGKFIFLMLHDANKNELTSHLVCVFPQIHATREKSSCDTIILVLKSNHHQPS